MGNLPTFDVTRPLDFASETRTMYKSLELKFSNSYVADGFLGSYTQFLKFLCSEYEV
jgi:hypothetical protein